MINKRINQLVKKFSKYDIDGYIIPKNDEFFSEYAAIDRLKTISNFDGSAGIAIVLKRKIICSLMEDIPFKLKSNLVNYLKLLKFTNFCLIKF